jgi:hypothetical protein
VIIGSAAGAASIWQRKMAISAMQPDAETKMQWVLILLKCNIRFGSYLMSISTQL